MKQSNKQFLMQAREKFGLRIVKQPMDGGYMLAIYTKDGQQIFHETRNEPSETAYVMMYPSARKAVADYFGLYKETIIDGVKYRESYIEL